MRLKVAEAPGPHKEAFLGLLEPWAHSIFSDFSFITFVISPHLILKVMSHEDESLNWFT